TRRTSWKRWPQIFARFRIMSDAPRAARGKLTGFPLITAPDHAGLNREQLGALFDRTIGRFYGRNDDEASMQTVRLGDRNKSAHLYDVEVNETALPVNGSGGYFTVQVDADTRSQASAIAKRAGYSVRSVNMVG
ncbi:hypothetical protein P0E62_13625, partial [Enterococcus faecalis]|uniref:hypothetical protein n=6 Tax=Bacteria TaxID=2 RepID=UPI0025B122BF